MGPSCAFVTCEEELLNSPHLYNQTISNMSIDKTRAGSRKNALSQVLVVISRIVMVIKSFMMLHSQLLIIIQGRVYGNEDFNRSWADYRTGFDDRMRDVWIGNEDIFALSSSGRYELRMEVLYQKKMEVCQLCQLFYQQRENNVQARPRGLQWYRRGLLKGKTQRLHVQYF